MLVISALLAWGSSPVDPSCQARLDTWCSCHAHCSSFPRCGPMAAAIGPEPGSTKSVWRCYPAAQLDQNHTWIPHRKPASICTRTTTLEEIVSNCSTPVLPPACSTPVSPTPAPPLPPGLTSMTRVFAGGGTTGCVMYRTPSLVLAPSGELLAFSQCRQASHGDRSPMELRVRHSTDHGRTWSNESTLPFARDPGLSSLHRAQTVLDKSTGAIFLFDDPNHYPTSVAQNCSVHVWRTDDLGRSWRSVENTSEASALGSGLTNGVQLGNGKLVVPHRNGCNAVKADGAHALWSTDHGETWTAGESTPSTAAGASVNECALAPLANGSLLMVARSGDGGAAANRVSTVSDDEGATWRVPRVEHLLGGFATCEGSLLSHRGDLFFSHPQDPAGTRSMLTIRASRDNGDSWPVDSDHSLLVYAGPSAYSALGETALGELAVLWEADDKDLLFATTKKFDH